MKMPLLILALLLYFTFPSNAQNNINEKASYSITTWKNITPGYISIENNELFYLLVKSQKENSPLVIYFAGGPGASSIFPAFIANGPFNLVDPFANNSDFKLKINKWSWNKIVNVVYLDQPRYVGFSYGTGDYLTSLSQAGNDFIKWLFLFYDKYPELKNRSLYLAGESFAGAYIAQFSHEILSYNLAYPSNKIPIAGVFVESGIIGKQDLAPAQTHFDYFCKQKFIKKEDCEEEQSISLKNIFNFCVQSLADEKKSKVNDITIADLKSDLAKQINSCVSYLNQTELLTNTRQFTLPNIPQYPEKLRGIIIDEPFLSMEFSSNSQVSTYLGYSPNPYNMLLPCQKSSFFPPWCYNNAKLINFFNNKQIRNMIGQGLIPSNLNWEFASFSVNVALSAFSDNTANIQAYYTEALKNGLKVKFIYGKDDWQMNYLSEFYLANQLSQFAYNTSLPKLKKLPFLTSSENNDFLYEKNDLGEYTETNNLSFYQINKAGHEVGMDQAELIFTLLSELLLE